MMFIIMKTMINKVYYLSLLLTFCSLALPVRGQKALDEMIQKNVSLEKDIELLRQDSSKVKNGLKNILVQIEKDSVKNKELTTKYNSLLSIVSQDSVAILTQYVDSLEKQHKALEESIMSIKKDIALKTNELKNADSELQNMNVYSEIEKQQTYKNNLLYLTKRYSQMSLEKLAKLTGSMGEFRSLEGFSDYQKRVVAAVDNKKLYVTAWECVSAGKGYQDVDTLRSEIIALLEIKKDEANKGIYKLTKEQFGELDSLDVKLSRFNNGIKELKKIVEGINKNEIIVKNRSERRVGSKKDCLDLMRQYIVPEKGTEQDKIYQRYLAMIPYLEKLLRDYWNELKRNPFDTPTESEKIITNLIVK